MAFGAEKLRSTPSASGWSGWAACPSVAEGVVKRAVIFAETIATALKIVHCNKIWSNG